MTQPIAIVARPSQQRRTPAEPGELKFDSEGSFYRELRSRVDDYFKRTGKNRRDCPRMYLKTAVVLGWFAASYVLLVFIATTWWMAARPRNFFGAIHGGHRIQHSTRR